MVSTCFRTEMLPMLSVVVLHPVMCHTSVLISELVACRYSRDFLPIFAEASTEAPKVTFAAIQCDEHPQACATISDMEGFPHVKFFEGHGESMVTFEGERSVEGLLDFVQENTFGLGVPQKQEL
eukprot:m.835613 g.835613  ORF g.835613 m.835613 type:complete len:124 (-) comp23455_c0_seq34:1342-1713(-)